MPRPRKKSGDTTPPDNREISPETETPVDTPAKAPLIEEEDVVLVKVEGGEVVDAVGADALVASDEEDVAFLAPTINDAIIPVQAAVEAEIVTGGDTDEGGLTDDQRARLLELEHQVEESFYRAGLALREIRDSRLYRETHDSFEDYCLDRFGFKRRHPYQLIDAASIADNIRGCARPARIMPTNEYQLRPLVKLKDAEQQAEAWTRAVEKAAGKPPTYELVKETVTELLATENDGIAAPLRLEVNQPVFVKRADDELLSDLIGAWGIVRAVDEQWVTVEFYAGMIANIDRNCLGRFPKDPSGTEMRSLEKTLSQLKTILALNPDEAFAKNVVKYFARLRRPTLTALERYVLTALERRAVKEERRAPDTE